MSDPDTAGGSNWQLGQIGQAQKGTREQHISCGVVFLECIAPRPTRGRSRTARRRTVTPSRIDPAPNVKDQMFPLRDVGKRLQHRFGRTKGQGRVPGFTIECAIFIIECPVVRSSVPGSMTVAMLGKFYQYKDNKGTDLLLYGNMQVMFSLVEGAFHCLL